MATVDSDLVTKSEASKPSDGLTSPLYNISGLYVLKAKASLTSAAAANDIIKITYPLPGGLALVPEFCRIVKKAASASTGLSVSVGTEADPDLYSAAIDVKGAASGAGGTVFEFSGGTGMLASPKIPAGTEIIAKVTAASGVTSSDLYFTLVFTGV